MKTTSMIASVIVIAMLGASFGALVNNATADRGGRDSFGYRWTDSNSPAPNVTYSWVDIASTGTRSGLTGDDYYGGPFSVGFNFTYYGTNYSTFYISTNGFISFGSGSSALSNRQIPYSSSPNNFIAAYWDDLYIPSNTIYYQTLGVEPYRSLVVEYYQVRELGYSNLMSFEIILNETGNMLIQYETLNGYTGDDATVGIENSTGTVGVQYSYESVVLTDHLAVEFSRGFVMLLASQTDSDGPGNVVSYDLTVTNIQTVSDSFAITAYSPNGWALGLYDSGMNPLIDHDGDMIPDTDVIAPSGSAYITVTVTIPGSPTVFQDITLVNATSFTTPSVNDTVALTTNVADAWFTPPHSDEGWDRYISGDYAYLYVNVTISVRTAGWFYVVGPLHTTTHSQIAYQSNGTYFDVGTYTLGLKYYSWDITEHAVDGPYHIDLELRDGSWNLIDQDLHTTASYTISDFQELPGAFVTPFTDTAVDTDLDGLWDYLQIDYAIAALYDSRLRVRAYLYDESWNLITQQETILDFATGTTSLQVSFDAWDIAKNGMGGTFTVYFDLDARMDNLWFNDDYYYHYTNSYAFDSFERPPALFAPPHDEHVVDLDSDSLWDYLVIEVQVNVTVEGDYSITGLLTDDSGWTDIDTVTNSTHLEVGEWTVELAYLGYIIRMSGEDGDYNVALTIRSGSTDIDTDDYLTTGSYWDTSFEQNPGSFTPPHNAGTLDNNGDGFFDYLIVNASVTVTMAGTYAIYAGLRNSWWSVFEEHTNTTYLDVGTTMVELRFAGWVIRYNGDDAPFTVLLELRDSGSRLLDSDSFMTPAYLYTQFENFPATLNPPHTVGTEDTDSDGLFENLLVDVSVDVVSAGTFIVEGYLYDSGWNTICMNGTIAVLPTGISTVQLRFPAFMIYANMDNGTYHIYVELQDENGYELDSGNIVTSFLYYDSFDPEVPRIDSVWADIQPTMDGIIGATEWSTAAIIDLQMVNPANGVAGSMMVMNDGVNLYIAYDVYGDTTEDDGDYCSVGFDTGDDDLTTDGEEDQFYLSGSAWNPSYHFVYESSGSFWTTHCSPFDDSYADHTGLAGAVGFGTSTGHPTDHRVYELSVPLSLLGAAPGGSIGFLGRSYNYYGIYDSYTGEESAWPVMSPVQPMITQYGDLRLAAGSVAGPPTTSALVSGTAGTAGWYVSNVAVSFSATGGRGGVDHTEYRLGAGSWIVYTTPIDLTTEGTYSIEFRSIDNFAQVESTKTITVYIDKTAPTAASEVSGNTVWFNGTDSLSGIGPIMYRINNGTWAAYSGAMTLASAGTYYLEFYALDAAGNQGVTQSVTVVVEGDDELPGNTESFPFIWLGLIAAIVAAALILLLVLMKRKKRQAPAPMVPPPQGFAYAGAPMPPPPPPMPPQQ